MFRLPAFASSVPLRPPCARDIVAAGGVCPLARIAVAPSTKRPFLGAFLRRRRTRSGGFVFASADVAPVEEEVDPGAVEGTDLRVLRYPHPLLRAENAEVREDEMDEIRRISKEMLLVMYASGGVGLAAPQVGVNKRLMVFNAEGDKKAWLQEVVMVNPVVIGKSKPSDEEAEGCLSFPDMGGVVRRHTWVKVEATRLNGKKFKVKYEGWKARIFQHEYDHLDGTLYIDRLDGAGREKVEQRLEELIAEYEGSPYDGLPPAL